MSNLDSRSFVMTLVAGSSALTDSLASARAAAPVLPESDLQAVALGYENDTTKVDKTHYPQHAARWPAPLLSCSNARHSRLTGGGQPATAQAV